MKIFIILIFFMVFLISLFSVHAQIGNEFCNPYGDGCTISDEQGCPECTSYTCGDTRCDIGCDASGCYQETCGNTNTLPECNTDCGVCCINDCSFAGQTTCQGDLLKTCGNYDADSCLDWSTPVTCTPSSVCKTATCNPAQGVCVETDKCSAGLTCNPSTGACVTCDGCSVGTKQCSGFNTYQTCNQLFSGCNIWGTSNTCPGDGLSCTQDSCTGAGVCTYTSTCPSGQTCTSSGCASCTSNTQCVTPPPTGCYDTQGACTSGTCVYTQKSVTTQCGTDSDQYTSCSGTCTKTGLHYDYHCGDPTGASAGQCVYTSTSIIDPCPSGTACSAGTCSAATETCNGIDDDCDGQTDCGDSDCSINLDCNYCSSVISFL